MLRRPLRSQTVWRLSGLSYLTGILATRGKYMSPNQYLADSYDQMMRIPWDVRGKAVLEFGCGLGGNLLAISSQIKSGVGVDVNRGYLRIARGLAKRYATTNVRFDEVSRESELSAYQVDAVFSIGVFERLSDEEVLRCVSSLADCVSLPGEIALYFLCERARGSEFTERLGDEAYHFWTESAIQGIFNKLRLSLVQTIKWNAYSDLYLVRKQAK